MQDQNTKDHRDSHHRITEASSCWWCTHCESTPSEDGRLMHQPSLPSVLQTLNSVSNQGVDIQLKILQALLSVLTYNPDAHGEILGNVRPVVFIR